MSPVSPPYQISQLRYWPNRPQGHRAAAGGDPYRYAAAWWQGISQGSLIQQHYMVMDHLSLTYSGPAVGLSM